MDALYKHLLCGMPAPTHDPRQIGVGDASVCDGCGETMEPREQLISVNGRDVLALRFHETCNAAWSTFEAGVSILLVDDDADNRELLQTYLTYVGATVRKAPPAIVVADVMMPHRLFPLARAAFLDLSVRLRARTA